MIEEAVGILIGGIPDITALGIANQQRSGANPGQHLFQPFKTGRSPTLKKSQVRLKSSRQIPGCINHLE